jgi:hypothetical protein
MKVIFAEFADNLQRDIRWLLDKESWCATTGGCKGLNMPEG